MPVVVLFIIFVLLLVIAVPVSITLGITSVLPSICDPSFTVGAKYLIRAMFGGLDSFPLLAVPMFVLSSTTKRRILFSTLPVKNPFLAFFFIITDYSRRC